MLQTVTQSPSHVNVLPEQHICYLGQGNQETLRFYDGKF